MKDLKADFGGVGDGVTDDTAAVQSALSWAATARDELVIPIGHYRITSQLTVTQGNTFKVRGTSRPGANYNTSLRWDGAPGGTMLLLDGCRETEWWDFAIDASNNAAIEPAVLLDIDKVTPGSWNSRKNAFRRMLLRGGSLATVRISNATGVNNEGNVFEDVDNMCAGSSWNPATGTGPVGYLVKNVNAKAQIITRGEISGKECAVWNQDGSSHLYGVQIGGCGTWLRHGGRGETSSIVACDGDSSRTFLETTITQTAPILAEANRFVQGHDGPMFVFADSINPVTLRANEFASGAYRAPAICYTLIPPNTTGPVLIAEGNSFPNDQMLPVPGLQSSKFRSLYALGNSYYAPGNARGLMNDYLVPFRANGNSTSGLQIGGASGFVGEAQNLNGGATINSNQPFALINSNANITLAGFAPCIRPGLFVGQRLALLNNGNFGISFPDRTIVVASGLSLTSPVVTLPAKGFMSLVWNGSFWIQVSPVVSPL